jgi:predicted permease
VTFEVATASLLVVASGLLVESIVRLSRVDPGFQSDRVTAFGLVLPQRKYPNQASVRALQTQLMERLASTPGIESAGFVSALPFRQPGISGVVQIEGQTGAEQRPLQTSFLIAGGSYFQAMSIPLRRGRLFGPQDASDGMPVVVIDDAAARFFWPSADPIGKRLNFTFERDKDGQPVWREVVGVVGHVRTQQLQAGTDFQFYTPVDQGSARGVTYVVRGTPSRPDLAAVVRDSVRAVAPDLPLHDLQPMPAIVAESFALLRAAVAVVGAFGSMAALLTGIGVYGVISFLVALRKRELGVKLALGATASQIRGEVMGAALRLAAIGVFLAAPAALALSWSIRSLLFGVSPFNPWIQVGAAIVILGLVALASYGPAKTATHIDPVQTLRQG